MKLYAPRFGVAFCTFTHLFGASVDTQLKVTFDVSLARSYPPVPQVKLAVLVIVPEGIITTIVPEWGGEQKFVGKWFGIIGEDDPAIKYGSAYDEFISMHAPVEGVVNGWQKNQSVDAYQYSGEPGVLTTVLADGTEETTKAVNPGDWIVRQVSGEVMCISRDKFPTLYQV